MAKRLNDTSPVPSASLRSFFQGLVRAFLPAAYPQLAAQRVSAGALYLVGVVFLVSLLLTPLLYVNHERGIAAARAYFERALPEDLYFENGEAHFDGEQPYSYVEEVGEQHHVLIVDTTGQTTAVPDQYEQGMLITRNSILHKIRLRGSETRTIEDPIPPTSERIRARQFYVDALAARKWRNFALSVGLFFFWAALPLFGLATLAGGIGFALERARKTRRLPFRTCFNITAYAATPVAFATASAAFPRTLSQFYLLVGVPLLLFLVLATLGTQACRRAQEAA